MQRVSRRFAFVDPTVVRLHVEWDSPSTRGTPSSRHEPPFCHRAVRRGPAVGPPGRRVLSLAAPSPSCQVVASLSSRCSAGRRAARPYYKGRLCSQNAPFDEIAWIRLGHSGLARRASCKTPGQSRALEPCEKEGGASSILFRRYVHFACANGRDSMDFRSPGRLRGESGPLAREVKADSWPKGACGSEANRGPQATRGSEAGRAFGLYCTNRHGRCACSGGQG